jgi:scyllo-inositol 2-dehydrogenase (NADP+)
MSGALRIAIIGSGWVSLNRHLPALAVNSNVTITGIIAKQDSIDAVDPRLLSKFGVRATGTSFDTEIVASADALMIGTPPTTHTKLVKDAIQLGKHVLVEKPMTLLTSEADELMELARKSHRVLAVVHNLNFSRAVTEARQLLESGHLGELKAVLGLQSSNHQRRLPVWYPELPLGLFTDEAAHLIYLAQSFLPNLQVTTIDVGPPVNERDLTPDGVTISMRSSDQRPATLHMSFVGAISEWALILEGDRRTAVVDLFRDILVVLENDGRHTGGKVLRTSVSAIYGHARGVFSSGALRVSRKLDYGNSDVVRQFVGAVTSKTESELISAQRGKSVVEVIERAHMTRAGS